MPKTYIKKEKDYIKPDSNLLGYWQRSEGSRATYTVFLEDKQCLSPLFFWKYFWEPDST